MSLLGTADGQDSQTMALCAVPDHARLGALRVSALNQTPADPAPTKFFLPFACDIEHMGAMVRAFLDCRETPRQLLLLLYGFSALGGAQPKCSFVSEDRPLSVAKFFGPEHPSWMPRAEVLFSTLALAAGLRTVQPRLLHPIDSPIVITSRFDRDQAGRRTPYLSARSMLLIRPADRVSWMDLLAQMRLYCNNFATDALEIWRRLLFGYLIGKSPVGVDDFGFLYAGLGKWQLAPACGFRPSVPGTQSTTADSMQALAVPLDIESLMACADQFGLTQAQARVELRQQLDVLRTWKRRAVEFACNMNHRDIDQLAPIIDNIDVRQA
jgi:serine/threonine-protein kinase HipA